MKIVVCPSDETGCGKYRLIWPAEALKSQDLNISIEKRPRILIDPNFEPPKVKDVLVSKNTDVIIFQRPASYQISQIIPILKDKGIKIVIDIDDDFETLHKLNPAFEVYNDKDNAHRNHHWMKKACSLADVVTATTERLLEKYASKNGVLIPNCIPQRYLEIEHKPDEMVNVGWAGWVRTHPTDLQITHGAINEAISKQNARFLAIGDPDIFSKLGIRNRFPHEFVHGVAIDNYSEVISKLDIGIVPLDDIEFNQSKSWLKALEYAAIGVAPVVSPTPDNMKLVEQGAAYVARSPKEWRDKVRSLIVNEGERLNLIQKARTVASNWTIEGNAWRWKEAWCTL